MSRRRVLYALYAVAILGGLAAGWYAWGKHE
jgi:hypothetical protein